MAKNSFIQGENLFTYSGTNCIRNDYFHNDCQICVDLCPKGAFHIIRNRLTLFDNECIACSACIGSCPTEALQVKSFDPNAFVLAYKESESREISCKNNTPCLGVFDQHHLISLALQKELTCNLSHCSDCSLNTDTKVETVIRTNIAKANHFFQMCGVAREIALKEEREDVNERRMLFRSALTKAKESVSDEEGTHESLLTREHQARLDSHEPLKHLHLKKYIRDNLTEFTTTKLQEKSDLFFEKVITFEACTNCGDCVQFCPTQALGATPDKQGIFFTSGACIGCGICDHICKTDAITTKTGVDLVNAVFNRTEELVHYEMVMCHECRCPYPYRGGDPICDRCADFKKDFDGMFTLAKDL